MQEQGIAHACKVVSHDSLLCKHHIAGHLMYVLVPTELVMMYPVIDYPTSSKIHIVIYFLHSKNMCAAEIHCEL